MRKASPVLITKQTRLPEIRRVVTNLWKGMRQRQHRRLISFSGRARSTECVCGRKSGSPHLDIVSEDAQKVKERVQRKESAWSIVNFITVLMDAATYAGWLLPRFAIWEMTWIWLRHFSDRIINCLPPRCGWTKEVSLQNVTTINTYVFVIINTDIQLLSHNLKLLWLHQLDLKSNHVIKSFSFHRVHQRSTSTQLFIQSIEVVFVKITRFFIRLEFPRW